ncbi:MAG: nucleoside hydrolase [Deltaproteobacteria bacterium]|nr:MAG: nucleoside hydrolase [Deltaproteobacteria bacterium]
MPRPILFDTDIGTDVDDSLALGVVLASREALELVAVTTVSGKADVRARIAARLLGLAGRSDVEVCIGESAPILRPEGEFVWRGLEESFVAEGPEAPIVQEPAPERIARAAREVPGLELVMVGPLTNLARALALDPGLPKRVAGVTIMGGHVRRVAIGEHVCEPGIDYNLCRDLEASCAVLGAGFPITLVTADVTLQTWMTTADRTRLASGGAVARAIADQVGAWTPWQRKIFTAIGGTLAEDNAAFLHDPLTVYSLIDPSPLHFEELRIVPTIQDGVFRTLEADPAAGIGMPMRVATAVDAEAARRGILERLCRL